jgi:hypothetical protein
MRRVARPAIFSFWRRAHLFSLRRLGADSVLARMDNRLPLLLFELIFCIGDGRVLIGK